MFLEYQYKVREICKIKDRKNKYNFYCAILRSVPATRSARPGFESRPEASPQSGLRGGRSLCEYCANKLIKLGSGWL